MGQIFAIIDFFGSVVLVWVAFALLPCSSKHGLQTQLAAVRENIKAKHSLPVLASQEEEGPKQGGRLLRILWWDLASFMLCLSGLVGLQYIEGYGEFLTNLFWCRVAYSMLSFPFFFFYLPGLRQLLTHAEPTGFASNGRCVPFELRKID